MKSTGAKRSGGTLCFQCTSRLRRSYWVAQRFTAATLIYWTNQESAPEGRPDNSPALQRWEKREKGPSPGGTTEVLTQLTRNLRAKGNPRQKPTHRTCRALLTRYCPAPARKTANTSATLSSNTRSSEPNARSLSTSSTPNSRPANFIETRIFDRLAGCANSPG